ncbi:hypothetical protein ID866_6431 [Astraeus odoratus]|nr:hypothetical protein ID866_6431 [Astraeus odoratus]
MIWQTATRCCGVWWLMRLQQVTLSNSAVGKAYRTCVWGLKCVTREGGHSHRCPRRSWIGRVPKGYLAHSGFPGFFPPTWFPHSYDIKTIARYSGSFDKSTSHQACVTGRYTNRK